MAIAPNCGVSPSVGWPAASGELRHVSEPLDLISPARRLTRTVQLFLLFLSALSHSNAAEFFLGCCGTSAGASLDQEHFVVADDEDNRLRLYSASAGGEPVQIWNFDKELKTDKKSSETDIEGAARIGDVVYWIGSHGRNKDGELRASRHVLFATAVMYKKGKPQIKLQGRPYRTLLLDLRGIPALNHERLQEAGRIPPKAEGGLNIEGLSARREGGLWIGFRNPVPGRLALLVALLNPESVVLGATAKFGPPARLDLGGFGIRDMAFDGKNYWILAGPIAGPGVSRLYTWGGGSEPALLRRDIPMRGLNPEAIIVQDGAERSLLILSDDGGQRLGGKRCEDWPKEQRRFRAIHVPFPR